MFSHRSLHDPAPNALSRLILEKRATGADLFDLTISNPTVAGFVYDKKAIRAAFSRPEILKYDPDPRGLPAARRAVSDYYAASGNPVDPQTLFLTPGTSDGYAAVFKVIADPGDAILIPEPGYPLLAHLAGFEGLTTTAYPLRYDPDNGWTIDLDVLSALVTPTTRAVVVVNPSNPTGQFLKEPELGALDEVCLEKGLALIVDEVFSDYGTQTNRAMRVRSAAGRSRALTFDLNGISKMLGLPQLKLGWIAVSGDSRLVTEACARLEFVLDFYLSTGTPVQHAAGHLMPLRHAIQHQIRRRLDTNERHLRDRMAGVDNMSVLLREGGWYAVIRVSSAVSDEGLAVALVREDEVIVHPGYFYDFPGDGFLVVSLLPPAGVFQAGIERLAVRWGIR